MAAMMRATPGAARRSGAARAPRAARPAAAPRRAPRAARRARCRAQTLASVEASELINREVVLFLMRMDLSTQLRRASTMENQGAVRLIQSNLEEIEAYLQELERDKRANASTAGKGSADGAASDGEEGAAATDPVAKGLQLRGDLQRAVEAEDYAECARIRDELAALEAAAFASEAAAAVRRNARGAVELHLGAKVALTAQAGGGGDKAWRGVICGFDTECCESADWRRDAGVADLPGGDKQPFYHVLIERQGSDESGEGKYSIAYVAQDNLWLTPDEDEFAHPYTYLLFLGMDSDGDYIPTRQLRERFGSERREDLEDEVDEEEEGDGTVEE